MFRLFKTTERHKKYWKERHNEPGFDWKKSYLDGWDHPHRELIVEKVRKARPTSLLEVGCASGPNLYKIKKTFPHIQIGGADISVEAIKVAKEALGPLAILDVASADDLFFSDKSVDCVLTDMALIYMGPTRIRRAIREIARVARKNVIICEFHSANILKRVGLRMASGYNAYNYRRLLEREGFYDIVIDKIPESAWPGGEPQKTFGYIITARI